MVLHFSLQQIFYVFFKIFGEGFFDGNVQLKVANTLNCHNVVKLVHISTIQLSIGVHFKFAIMCHKHNNVQKRQGNIDFNGNLSMKLCTYKETTIMNNLPH
jgi:hypothetical protein